MAQVQFSPDNHLCFLKITHSFYHFKTSRVRISFNNIVDMVICVYPMSRMGHRGVPSGQGHLCQKIKQGTGAALPMAWWKSYNNVQIDEINPKEHTQEQPVLHRVNSRQKGKSQNITNTLQKKLFVVPCVLESRVGGRPEVLKSTNYSTFKSWLGMPGQLEKKYGPSTAKMISGTSSSLLHLKGVHIPSVRIRINTQTGRNGYFSIKVDENVNKTCTE